MTKNYLVVAVLGMACSFVSAEVKLASVFTDHMVLQRDKAVKVWGMAEAGKKVTVKVGDRSASAKAGADGKWVVKLKEHKASETPAEMVVSEEGGNTVKVSDILYGDVWVASGQSNMEFHLERAANATEAIAGATDDKVRLLVVPHMISDEPQKEQKGTWAVCSPASATGFSAVAYFFAKELREKEHVPVGLVGTYWGGTPAESWTSKSFLGGPEWAGVWEKDRQMVADYPQQKAAWEEKVKGLDAKAKKPPMPLGANNPHRPSVLWNGMVEPLLPMSITGVIWYQGEANAGRAEQYQTLFPTMIKVWREAFGQGDVPFLFVQLANYNAHSDTPAGSAWAELRGAQTKTLAVKNTGMAVTIDIGNPNNIHPTDKQTVGKRLALAAEKIAYDHDVEWQGPTYKSMSEEGGKVTVKFKHADGLMAKGGEVKGFMVAGEDKKFVPAEAKVEGEKVVVSAAGVGRPVAVRYAWSDVPEANLYNGSGLPMVPFRSDEWAMVTEGKK